MTVLGLLLNLVLLPSAAATLRGAQRSLPQEVRPREIDGYLDFVPLACNNDLPEICSSSFAATYGDLTHFNEPITIPCGQCYNMDLSREDVIFRRGLFIEGKLVFPEKLQLRVVAPMIIVQGELEMSSTTKPVDGKPTITFEMVGENDNQSFTPIHENAYGCSATNPTCEVGKKAIVVAGGKVTLRGLPPQTRTWTKVLDTPSDFNQETTFSVQVDADHVRNWAAGAEILFTSHTQAHDDQQVRKIFSISKSKSNPNVADILVLPAIKRPISARESPDFAVEVALLSRNIVFEGGHDSNENHGGHFWIMHTPEVAQTVEGIEVKNFGQQGSLGRYPIHFHYNNEGRGSVIARNTVRDSNQRCIVVHGTNNLLIEENIAFNTAGHCFMTEDGMETGNMFRRNLGAKTVAPKVIIEDYGPNGKETDYEPATFWIPSTRNAYVDNCAAGSVNSGFWIEPVLRGTRQDLYDFDPMTMPLSQFSGNIAHSNEGKTGAIRLYTPGYMPTEIAVFDDLKVFRNEKGIFLHKNYNILVTGSLFADNNRGSVDIDRATGIAIRNTRIVGESEAFRKVMQTHNAKPPCSSRKVVGIDLHTWKLTKHHNGVELTDITFEGFKGTVCEPRVIDVDEHTLKQGQFELFTSIRGFKMDGAPESINLCDANNARTPIDDIYFVDQDGSLAPPTLTQKPSGYSTLMFNGENIRRFTNNQLCSTVEGGCYTYCRDTCFQSVRIEVDPQGTENLALEVRRRGHGGTAVFRGARRANGNRGAASEPRTFIAHLPTKEFYNARFINRNGMEVRPTVRSIEYEDSLCSKDDNFQIFFPSTDVKPASRDECANLISNSDMEHGHNGYWESTSSFFTYVSDVPGYHSPTAIQHQALRSSEGLRFKTETNMNFGCLAFRTTWQLSAQIRLETPFGAGVSCGAHCPQVNLVLYSVRDQLVFDLRSRDYAILWDPNGFNLLQTEFEVPKRKWNGVITKVDIIIDGYDSRNKLIVDDFAITPL